MELCPKSKFISFCWWTTKL